MKMNIIGLLFSILMFSCHKDEFEPFTPPEKPISTVDPEQYGTPFTQVPETKDVIMYQVNIRAFSNGGRLQGVTDRLDSIKALGINVIYLMPIYPIAVERSVNSPYSIKNYMEVNSEMGTLADLRTLVDGAHQRNMAVILDWVANHTSWDNPWITSHNSWYKKDANGAIIAPPNTGWTDVAQLDYNNMDMRKEMIRAMKSWIFTANVDGYRCDAADFVPEDFWKQAIDTLRNISTHKLIMLAEGTRNNHFNAGFQLKYGFEFLNNLENNIFGNNASVKSIDAVNGTEFIGSSVDKQTLRYTSNHDINLLDGTPAELFNGNAGALAAFVVSSYMKGVPMIYNGQEMNHSVRLNYFGSTTIIDWTPKPEVTEVYKQILAFRKSSEALKSLSVVSYSGDDVCAFEKTAGSEKVLVIVNLRNANINYAVPAAISNTTWTNAMENNQYIVGTQISLAPFQYIILKKG